MKISKVDGLLKAEIIIKIVEDKIIYAEDEAGVSCDCVIEPYADGCYGLTLNHSINKNQVLHWQKVSIYESGNSDVMFVKTSYMNSVSNRKEGFNDEDYSKIADYVINELIEFEKLYL